MADVKQSIASIIAAHKAVPLVNAPADTIEAGEIVRERKESMKVFDAANGQRTAHIYACPIHFRDKDGTFKCIDHTVKRKPLADPLQKYLYETKSGVYHAHFDKDRPWNYRFEAGDSWIEYEAQFDESASLSIDVQTSRVGVKETITLLDKTAPTKLSWKISRSGAGIITPPPVAVDADGKPMVVKVNQDGDVLTYDMDVTDAVFPVMVDPTSVIATNDGSLSSQDGNYTTARNDVNADAVFTSYHAVGQRYNASLEIYYIHRSFTSFAIPNTEGNVTSVSLFLYGNLDESTTDFNIYIHTSTYSNPLVVGDFDLFDGHQASGTYNGTVLNNTWGSSSFSATWNEVICNVAGLAVVQAAKNTTLRLVLISKKDYDNSAPTGYERVYFESSFTAGKEPYLSITYTISVVEAVSALIEMEATIPSLIKSPVSTLIEMEAAVSAIKARIEAVSALLEMEAEVIAKWEAINSVSALIEMEAAAAEIKSIIRAVSALFEVNAEILNSIKSSVQSIIDMEANVTGNIALIRVVSALLEMEAEVTDISTHVLNLGGSITPVGSLVEIPIIVISVGGNIKPSGGVSLSNPTWMPVEDNLRWMGEWSATISYEIEDVVMYKTAEGKYHGFISRTPHNVGNIPTESYAHWARIVQARWKK